MCRTWFTDLSENSFISNFLKFKIKGQEVKFNKVTDKKVFLTITMFTYPIQRFQIVSQIILKLKIVSSSSKRTDVE